MPQGRKEAPNIILCCMQSAWYVKMEFEHTHTHREHRLFHCPRFEFFRQQLRTEIEADTGGAQTWEWDFLTGPGRRYLSRFLRVVHSVPLPHAEGEDE